VGFSSEVIKAARQANLPAFLMDTGIRLKKDGSRYRDSEHNSLIFKGNAYYWNSQNESGNALDYLTRHMGFTFQDAVRTLATRTGYGPNSYTDDNAVYTAQEKAGNYSRVIAYLTKTRNIDPDIILDCISRKLLYQTSTNNNAAFVMLDEHGQAVGEELQGTLSDKRFKGISKGTKYGYGFNIIPQNDRMKYLLFFESAVDLLSFWSISKRSGKTLAGCMLISMVGLKLNIIKHMSKTHSGQIVLAVDNDAAAHTFIEQCRIEDINFILRLPPRYKDWNDELKNG
jgi:hypothetical protein